MSGTAQLGATQLWRDAVGIPQALAATLEQREGFEELTALLGAPATRRIVVTGNGAAYYVGLLLWTAALAGRSGPEVLAVPAGVLASGDLAWRDGDVVLAVSSSGALRDVVELIEGTGLPRPFAAVTATRDSIIGRAADVLAVTAVESSAGATHTQSLLANQAAVLAVWAAVTGDRGLADAVAATPDLCGAALAAAPAWVGRFLDGPSVEGQARPAAATAFGTGPAWPAALEAALLLKEVARIPAEGMETREGATSGMYALGPGHLVLSLRTAGDRLAAQAEETCRRTGATVLPLPGGDSGDRRVAALTTFPAALALAIALGGRAGFDVDDPDWAAAYYSTTRASLAEPSASAAETAAPIAPA